MTEPLDEWIGKAEGDFDVAQREFTCKGRRNSDAICFHAQQCIEKLMKAVLIAHGVTPEYTHNLVYLDTCVKNVVESWESEVEDIELADSRRNRVSLSWRMGDRCPRREGHGDLRTPSRRVTGSVALAGRAGFAR